jgi:type IV pilus assembly protein PilQ
MLDKISPRKSTTIFLLTTFSLIYLVFSCAQAPTKKEVTGVEEERPAEIESIHVIYGPPDKETIIEITSSKLVPYAAFKLVQPLRVIVGINAVPAEELTRPAVIDDSIIKDIHFEVVEEKPISTRVIATLSRDVEYRVEEKDRTVRLSLFPKKQVVSRAIEEEEIGPKEARVFFSPGETRLNQILGIDFFMLPKGKSRVAVTTSKKAEYELSRKNTLTLLLDIKEATIIPELTRYIDSSQFKGVVSRITPTVKAAERMIGLEIELKEMVPYHLIQTDTEIRLDFNKTSVKPPVKKITPATLTTPLSKPEEVPPEAQPGITSPLPRAPLQPEEVLREAKPVVQAFKPPEKRYTGARMTLDFSNADIRNILKLIGEVSKRNIVWGPEVKGTVSMRLKDVPWDQALDVVLETNNLGTITEGNIIKVMTKEKIRELEKEEEEKRKREQERIKEEKAKLVAAEAEEPLVTGYIPVDFADAEKDIKPHIENIKSKRGTITVDKRTNTVIMTDIASIVEKAKNLVKEFDTPVKQIMIEARIVDASTSLSRDLGVQWTNIEAQRLRGGASFGIPTDATQFSSASGADQLYGGSFSSNAPTDWLSNIGLSFGVLSSSGNSAFTLNAALALAETEGKAKVISAPKVIASNGEEATIERGDSIIIAATENIAATTLDATLSLKVTPTVSFNNYVTLKVDVTDDQAPTTSRLLRKSVNTTLMIKSGDTVVIGGIYKEEKSEDESGIPGLSRIPFLGWLFRAERKTLTRSELLIFLTPTVLGQGKSSFDVRK